VDRLAEHDTERFLLELVADRKSGVLDSDRLFVEDSTAMGTGNTLLVTAKKTSKEYGDVTEGQLMSLRDAGFANVSHRGTGWEVALLPAAFDYVEWVHSPSIQRAAKVTARGARKYLGMALLLVLGAFLGQVGIALWSFLTGLILN
jgi:hypothetical protein